MKMLAALGSFTLLAAVASPAFADYFQPNFWRCQADPLFGSPSWEDTNPEGRTGRARTEWAKDAFLFWGWGPNPNLSVAGRFWDNDLDDEVEQAAEREFDIDLYPVYQYDNSALAWIGPGPNAAPTWHGTTFSTIHNRPYKLPGSRTSPNDVTTWKVTIAGLCEAGCYTPEQEVDFGGELSPVARAFAAGERKVTTLAPRATFDALHFIVNDVARWTVDIAPANQEIITLHMESGGELRVTTEHPLLTSEGVMKRAKDLVIGESLVQKNGSPDPIVSTEKQMVFTKVYNLRPATTDLTSNILVAQGYLNGSARYQSEYLKYLNRVLIRNKIPAELIPRGKSADDENPRFREPFRKR